MAQALMLSAQLIRHKEDMKDFSMKRKRKAPRASRKKKALNLNLKGFLRKGFKLTLLLSLFSASLLAIQFSRSFIMTTQFFKLTHVSLEGNKKVSRNEILKKAGIDDNSNIFSLDIKEAGKSIGDMPWVKTVSMGREFPNKLKIRIEEREPLALIKLEELYYVDEESNIFAKADRETGFDYPVVAGLNKKALLKGSKDTFSKLDKGLAFLKSIRDREGTFSWASVSELVVDKKGGITVYTIGSGIPVYLGNVGFEKKLVRAEKTLTDLKQRGVRARLIDADFADKVLVKKAI
ncbi:MAG: FtsQ-type POTRA domain-containing protein [bacterium]|nr:FtsQ-type POTRA domain-containing protein [bacterium]